MRRRGGLVTGVLVGVLALAAAGCGGGDGGGGSASATTAAPETTSAPETTTAAGGGGGNEFKLTATDFKFDQASLELQAGSEVKVEVSNQGQAEHNFTFEQAGADQDVEAGEDATVAFTAPDAGTYKFRCKYHPTAMKGTVTVT
jgi:plastocyanin